MTITRPFNAEDNEINKQMNEILEHWAEKHGEIIKEKRIYECDVCIVTESGRELCATMADGCRSRYSNVRNYTYLKEKTDGKYKRIKKSEW